MSALVGRLRHGPTLLLDGGMGSLLIARGLSAGTAPESWNLARPEDVAAAHRSYVEAGSDAVQTNSFGGHPLRLESAGLQERCEEIQAAAVRAARASGAGFVIGDVGPTGAYLPPVGRGDLAAFAAGFERQGRALAEEGVDGFHVETMSDLREARAALQALRRAAPGVPVFVSLTFERKQRGFFTVMGDALAASLRTLAEEGADAVGANCTLASPDMRALAEEARAAVAVPLLIQPNAGQPIRDGATVRYAQEPGEFARDVAAIVALGIEAVGGCCGTDARFIAALRARLVAAEARA